VPHDLSILAHRANWKGPAPESENRVWSVARCLAGGWGLELDIRRQPGGKFYVSHEPGRPAAENDAAAIFRLIAHHESAVVALNVKELGDEEGLLRFLARFDVWHRLFLFDMELIEPVRGRTSATYRRLSDHVALAARASDRGEPLDHALGTPGASVIWFDEFDGPWVTSADVARVRAAGRRAFMVSPDLHGGSLEAARDRWEEFLAWDVDGICTDYPQALQGRLRKSA
jgi:glycerophosphoryl diester phosphodiesterase